MKKLLSLLGITAMLTSAGSAVIITKIKPDTQTLQNKNDLILDNNLDGNKTVQINNLKKVYEQLSESEQKTIAGVMAKLPELNYNEITQYLANSKIDFIKNNQETIAMMYLSFTSMQKMSKSLVMTTASLNVDWTMMNQFVNLNFGNSNDYTPWADTYGPSSWWTTIWEWGFKIDFPEGDINVMRVVNLLFSLYNGVNFAPLESLLKSGNNFFDYIINIDQNSNDKVYILQNLLIKTETAFRNSGVPFTDDFYTIFAQLGLVLDFYKDEKLAIIAPLIKNTIEMQAGMTLEEVGTKYSGILNNIISLLGTANMVLNLIDGTIPGIVWNYIVDSLASMAKQMINADLNHNGVYIKFQQFLFPQGFAAR